MAKKRSKHDEYVEEVETFAAYVNRETMTIGIYATAEDALVANYSTALKRLKGFDRYFNAHVKQLGGIFKNYFFLRVKPRVSEKGPGLGKMAGHFRFVFKCFFQRPYQQFSHLRY